MSHGNNNAPASNDTDIDINKSFNEYDSEVKIDDSYNKSFDSHDNNSRNLNNNQTFNVDKSSDDDVSITKNTTENKSATDSFNKTDIDTDIDDSFNTKTENKVEDSHNTKTETDIDDSYNTSTSNTNLNVALENAFNTHKVEDSNNTKVENSHNTKTDIDDSYNSTKVDIDSKIEDAFNDYDNAFNDHSVEYGNINVDFEGLFNGAFSGGGNDAGFAVSQIANILDADQLQNVQYQGHGTFSLNGGSGDVEYAGKDSWDCVDDPFGGNTSADTSFVQTGSAFNFEVVLGANLQQNAIDSVVVGGNQDNDTTSHSGDSF